MQIGILLSAPPFSWSFHDWPGVSRPFFLQLPFPVGLRRVFLFGWLGFFSRTSVAQGLVFLSWVLRTGGRIGMISPYVRGRLFSHLRFGDSGA